MIGLERKYLIIGLLGDPLARVSHLVQTSRVFGDSLNICHQGFVCTQQVSVFLSHDINLKPEVSVPTLQLRILQQACLQLILKHLDLVAILVHHGRGRAHLLQAGLRFTEFLLSLLDLVVQDHHASTLRFG